MENKNANQPAFPEIKTSHENGYTNNERWDYGNTYSTGGLTKREYFAAMAMQGMLSNPKLVEILENSNLHPNDHCEFVTEAAIEHADELLTQLNNQSK